MAKKAKAETIVVKAVDSIQDIAKEDKRMKNVKDDLGSDIKYIYPFGSPVIDIPYGGGICSGKIYELYGWESVGKSTLSLAITIAFENFWKANYKKYPHTYQVKDPNSVRKMITKTEDRKYGILWIEAEEALDKVRAKWMGCNAEDWLILEGETIEDTEASLIAMLQKAKASGMVILTVWDTISATSTLAEREIGTNAGGMAAKPRLVRQMFRKIVPLIAETNSTLVLINQYNYTINNPGKPYDTPLPAIKFYASVRTEMKKMEELKTITAAGDEFTWGIVTQLKHEKNKLIQRGQKSLIVIDNERGIDMLDTSFRYLKRAKLVTVAGAGWTTIEVPERVFNKDNKEPIKMVEVKFQTMDKLREKIETEVPHLEDWMNYLIYRSYTMVSPLIKVKIIKRVWQYEHQFFGEKFTQLTDKEADVASMLDEQIKKDHEKEQKRLEKLK